MSPIPSTTNNLSAERLGRLSKDPLVSPRLFNYYMDARPESWRRLLNQWEFAEEWTAEEADEVLEDEELVAVPAVLRRWDSFVDPLYADKRSSNPKLRLLGVLDCGKTEHYKRALLDEHACNLRYLTFETHAELKFALAALTKNPVLRPQVLKLGFVPSEEELAAMGELPGLQGLQGLSIRGPLGAGLASIAGFRRLPQLRALDLEFTADGATKKSIEQLAEVPFTRLESFSLSPEKRGLPPGHSAALLAAPWLRGLRQLKLEAVGLRDADIERLAAHEVIPVLEALALGGHGSPEALARLLARLRQCVDLTLTAFMSGPSDDQGFRTQEPLGSAVAQALVASGCVPMIGSMGASFDVDADAIIQAAGADESRARTALQAARGW